MRRIVTILSFSVAAAGCTPASHEQLVGVVHSDEPHDSAGVLEEKPIMTLLEAFTNAKYYALETGDVEPYAAYFRHDFWPSEIQHLHEDDPEAIARIYQSTVESDTIPDRVTGTVKIANIETDAERLIVDFVETMQISANPSNPTSLAGENVYERTITLEREYDEFEVVDLAPMTDPRAIALPAEDISFDPSWAIGDDAVSFDVNEPSHESPYQTVAYAPTPAVTYADAWAYGHNTAWYSFEPADCTNFVSQALFYGGRPLTAASLRTAANRKSLKYWWYTSDTDFSYPWVDAGSLFVNMRDYSSSTRVWALADIKKGDVVFADWTNNGTVDHVMIVNNVTCSTSWSCIYIDQHSTARQNWALSKTIALEPNLSLGIFHPVF